MSTRAEICEQLKSVLDSLSPGEDIETALEEDRASLDGWGDFWAYCQKEHKKTVKTEFNQDTYSCTIILKNGDAPAPAPEPVVKSEPDPYSHRPPTEEIKAPVVDVEVEKKSEPKTSYWGNQG